MWDCFKMLTPWVLGHSCWYMDRACLSQATVCSVHRICAYRIILPCGHYVTNWHSPAQKWNVLLQAKNQKLTSPLPMPNPRYKVKRLEGWLDYILVGYFSNCSLFLYPLCGLNVDSIFVLVFSSLYPLTLENVWLLMAQIKSKTLK